MSRHTPLHDVHLALGATFTDFAGWQMPLRYKSELAEHRAVRAAAGLFDLTHMGEISITGPEAGAALDYALVGLLSSLPVGRARYTMLCSEDGGVIDDLVVYHLSEERYVLVVNASNTEAARAALTKRAENFVAEVRDVSADYVLLAVQGPRSCEIISSMCDIDVSALRYYAITEAVLGELPVLLARTGYTGEDGFELFVSRESGVRLWESVMAVGQSLGLVPSGLSARDTLRLEAGMPLYGHELDLYHSPFEAGLGRVVRLDKAADFVGRKALAARAGQQAKIALVGLVASGRRILRQGHPVLDTTKGEAIGIVTSGAPSPFLERPIAMAYVASEFAQPGALLVVDVRGSTEPVEVVKLPFYVRPDATAPA